jgi:hypothetical protein
MKRFAEHRVCVLGRYTYEACPTSSMIVEVNLHLPARATTTRHGDPILCTDFIWIDVL